jgi:hypothetical protein
MQVVSTDVSARRSPRGSRTRLRPALVALALPIAIALVVAAAAARPVAADQLAGEAAEDASGQPRLLVLALDGVPYRLARQVWESGAFEGWPGPRPLVSTFPSMTNVAFTALLTPLGAQPVRGYEVRHYDPRKNKVRGGGFASKKKSFAWKNLFDRISRGNFAKARIYLTPRAMTRAETDKVAKLVLGSRKEFLLAHVAATDMLMHFRGEEATLEALRQVAESIDELMRRHEEERGRPLRVVLLSDHGNVAGKIEVIADPIRAALEAAGLRPSKKLKRSEDVVVAAYGLVGYASFYSDPANAEIIATSLIEVDGVAFSAWLSGEREISVLSAEGLARIRWRDAPAGRRLQYERKQGDPLGLRGALDELEAEGRLDSDGFASREDWFEKTATAEDPDGVGRLADALGGVWVANPATVLAGLQAGYACGVRSVRIGAWFKGGHLEATHGGLDRDSSWGFFMDSLPVEDYPPVLRMDRALALFAKQQIADRDTGNVP